MITHANNNFASVPPEMKTHKQWIVWRYEERKERDGESKPTKIPYRTDCIGGASTTDPATWGTFEAACNAFNRYHYDGIGFVFSPDDPFFGVDLDKCRDTETGELADWAEDILKELDSYTEITPSETGLHVIAKGNIPLGGNRNGRIEMYDHGRYFTVTGEHLEGTPTSIEERQEAIEALHSRIFPKAARSETGNHSGGNGTYHFDMTDDELLSKAMAAKNGEAFTKLWQGDVSAYGGDDSAADLALCCYLAFWTGNDPARIDRIFRQGGLYRAKWERQDYRERTISKAIESTAETYNSGGNGNHERVTTITHADGIVKKTTNPNQETLPEIIVTNRHLRDISNESLQALYAGNDPPYIFKRGGELTRIGRNERGRPFVEPLTESALRGVLARVANFMRLTKNGDVRATAPPLDVTRDINSLGQWEVPPLVSITESPALRPDGTVITAPGYDEATGLFYAPAPGLTMPPIPDNPTKEELKKAIKLIVEVPIDFPFDGEASLANALGALISAVIRSAIKGSVPMPIIDKPQAGTGASLFVDASSIISTGHVAANMGMPHSEEEWEKKLSSHLLTGRLFCVIDNIEGKLGSSTLSRYLTSADVSIRPLGRSADIILPNNMTFIATGNNIRLGGDMPRRCYWIRLDAGVARPWMRESTFTHPNLREWVLENRGEILAAIFTVVRGWITAGRTISKNLPVLGGFEEYCRTIGAILEFMGIPGFLSNLSSMYDQMDIDTPQWEAFLATWHEVIGERPVTVAELITLLKECSELAAVLPDSLSTIDGRDYSRRMGNALAKRNQVRFPNGLMITKVGEKKRAITWEVVSY